MLRIWRGSSFSLKGILYHFEKNPWPFQGRQYCTFFKSTASFKGTCCFLKIVCISSLQIQLNTAYFKWQHVCLKRRLPFSGSVSFSKWKLHLSKAIALLYRTAWKEYQIDFKWDTLRSEKQKFLKFHWVQVRWFSSWRRVFLKGMDSKMMAPVLFDLQWYGMMTKWFRSVIYVYSVMNM